MNTIRRSLCVAVTGLIVGLFGAEAIAQQPTPAPTAKAAPAQPKATKAPAKAKTAATTSACKGLEQKACGAKSDCSWIAATKRKDGRDVKAYCRTKSKHSAAAKTKVKTVAKSAPAATPPAKQ